ncbi:MAG TPA: hypothetical protein VK983_05270 [Candidatus Limnocylindrales bacterium]|nr:hypothetical protein [Candidatus Limnocylindrales bacterium]
MIEKTYTIWGAIAKVVLIFFLIIMAVQFLPPVLPQYSILFSNLIMTLPFLVALLLFAFSLWDNWQIKKRPAQLEALSGVHGYRTEWPGRTMDVSQNLQELGRRDMQLENVVYGDDWSYGDYSYCIYKKSKHGEYKAETIHYSVVEVQLARPLPNMLFDSPKTHRRQFKLMFDASQKHSLEGLFDRHFTTYFPKYYSIDALSIITPEVMEAMLAADDCDIEIDGDKLYLYKPLIPVQQIPDLIDKATYIKDKLMNNIVTYRDERLPYAEGRKDVATFGTKLHKNPLVALPTLLIGLALLIGAIINGRLNPGSGINFSLLMYGSIFSVTSAYQLYKARRDNAEYDRRYRGYMNTLQEREQKRTTR